MDRTRRGDAGSTEAAGGRGQLYVYGLQGSGEGDSRDGDLRGAGEDATDGGGFVLGVGADEGAVCGADTISPGPCKDPAGADRGGERGSRGKEGYGRGNWALWRGIHA